MLLIHAASRGGMRVSRPAKAKFGAIPSAPNADSGGRGAGCNVLSSGRDVSPIPVRFFRCKRGAGRNTASSSDRLRIIFLATQTISAFVGPFSFLQWASERWARHRGNS